jgi:hypothetical protein
MTNPVVFVILPRRGEAALISFERQYRRAAGVKVEGGFRVPAMIRWPGHVALSIPVSTSAACPATAWSTTPAELGAIGQLLVV